MSAARLPMAALLALFLAATACEEPGPDFEIENLSNNTCLSEWPAIACNDSGHVVVAWTDEQTGTEDIWVIEKDEGGPWGMPYNLSQSGSANGSRFVSLCYDRFGTLHAAWQQAARGWGVVYTRREPGGTWAVPETIRCGLAGLPHVAVDDSGNVHLEFTEMGGWAICYVVKGSSGQWSAVRVLSDPGLGFHGSICALRNGEVVAAWTDVDSVPWQTYVAHRSPAGEWSRSLRPYASTTYCNYPSLASRADRAVLAMHEDRNHGRLVVLTYEPQAGWSGPDTTCPGPSRSISAVALDPDGALLAAWGTLPTELRLARRGAAWRQVSVCDTLDPSRGLAMAVMPNGDIHLVWATSVFQERPSDVFHTVVEGRLLR